MTVAAKYLVYTIAPGAEVVPAINECRYVRCTENSSLLPFEIAIGNNDAWQPFDAGQEIRVADADDVFREVRLRNPTGAPITIQLRAGAGAFRDDRLKYTGSVKVSNDPLDPALKIYNDQPSALHVKNATGDALYTQNTLATSLFVQAGAGVPLHVRTGTGVQVETREKLPIAFDTGGLSVPDSTVTLIKAANTLRRRLILCCEVAPFRLAGVASPTGTFGAVPAGGFVELFTTGAVYVRQSSGAPVNIYWLEETI